MDFFGGPRDGDRIVVKGNPETFAIPEEVRIGKRTASVTSTYRFEGGSYHYVGQRVSFED